MDKGEKIRIAKIALNKNLDYEQLMYSDYLYDQEVDTDDIWEYVTEGRERGTNWFNETYSEYLNK
jgi:hypothetical protein